MSRCASVAGLAVTAIKGTRLLPVERIELGLHGVDGDRRFFIVDARDRMLNGKVLGGLHAVIARWSPERRWLALELPGGAVVEGSVGDGAVGDGAVGDGGRGDGTPELATVKFFSRTREARIVDGPWAAALSDVFGQPLRLAEAIDTGTAVDRGVKAAVSLISRGSLERLAEAAGAASAAGAAGRIDARRFRMLIEIDGVAPHAEDAWVGRELAIGDARVRFGGNVGRCLVTSRDPESGEIDLPTLDLLGSYRREVETTEPLPFGIYGEVLSPGPVAVGDPVELL